MATKPYRQKVQTFNECFFFLFYILLLKRGCFEAIYNMCTYIHYPPKGRDNLVYAHTCTEMGTMSETNSINYRMV